MVQINHSFGANKLQNLGSVGKMQVQKDDGAKPKTIVNEYILPEVVCTGPDDPHRNHWIDEHGNPQYPPLEPGQGGGPRLEI